MDTPARFDSVTTVEPPEATRHGSRTGLAEALDPEWRRITHLVALAEALRNGATMDEGFAESFDGVAARVRDAREGGCWAGLGDDIERDQLARFVQLDLDVMALSLAPEARPALAPRLQSLQPQAGGPWPSLALLQELLMLDAPEDAAALYDRLSPDAPLITEALVRISGDGPYQVVRPTPRLARMALGRVSELAPPPGAQPETRRGAWRELILPERTLRALRDFEAWTRHARTLHTRFDTRALGGPLALFTGPSGVGKSFAARVIAGELSRSTGESWALYTVDLGRVMSKYVGETEQNLNALLDALEGRRAILQIDEADGLLGKRGDISDARDRYANLEVSHLLARFERHEGPVILTSNLRTNIDPAFLRRFQIVVDFPSPDENARQRLWELLLPRPECRAPGLDAHQLARSAQLSGGSIHNAAVYASVLAAEDDGPVTVGHVARAIWAELAKQNRQVRRSEVGELGVHLEEHDT